MKNKIEDIVTGLEFYDGYTVIKGRYRNLDCYITASVSNYEIDITKIEFLDDDNNTKYRNNCEEKDIKEFVSEWIQKHDDWQYMNEINFDYHEWHQQNLEDERMGN